MSTKNITAEIHINAIAAAVWRVFTDPDITRQMGGHYVTDWKPGSTFGWQGADGNMYTNGRVLEIVPGKLLKHNLFEMTDNSRLLSVITYKFQQTADGTTITALEEIHRPITNEEQSDAEAGWDAALQAVKSIAETL